MDETFDVRLTKDRDVLAARLPLIDGNEFNLSRQDFISALDDFVAFLGNHDWMVYRSGCFTPIPGVPGYIITLPMAIELGIQLRFLSQYDNFKKLLEGFANPSQFPASRFETKVAFYLSSLNSVDRLKFSPDYEVRGRDKKPDFDIIGAFGVITVECKQPKVFAQQTIRRVHRTVSEFQSAMKIKQWPKNLRLEIEIAGPLRGSQSELAEQVVESALRLVGSHADQSFSFDQVQGFVVQKSLPFRLIHNTGFLTNVLTTENATGPFNPGATLLRVIDKRHDKRIIRSLGRNITDALGQLPDSHDCLICVEETSSRIAKQACESRINDPAYINVLGIGLWGDEQSGPVFVSKKLNKDYLERLLGVDSQEV